MERQNFRDTEARYAIAAGEAKSLLCWEGPYSSPMERAREIEEILQTISFSGENGEPGKRRISVMIARLLRTDPLTDQQAGKIVRFQRGVWDNFRELAKKFPDTDLTFREEKVIHSGDFRLIRQVLKSTVARRRIWNWASAKENIGDENVVVFRGMDVTTDEVKLVARHGIVCDGLRRFITLENMVRETLWGFWGHTSQEREGYLPYLASQMIFSKVNALHQVYWAGEFGTSSTFKLGISTTTRSNLEKKHTGRFFGDHIFEIEIPRKRLITSKNEGDSEDERTIMFMVKPEEVKGIYRIDIDSPRSVMGQIEEAKRKRG